MSRRARRGRKGAPLEQSFAPVPEAGPAQVPAALPRGRIPAVGVREIVAAIHRRRERRRGSAAELAAALHRLSASVQHHEQRVAGLRQAIEAQGGDLSALQHYDSMMARLRAELRSTERALAEAFSSASLS